MNVSQLQRMVATFAIFMQIERESLQPDGIRANIENGKTMRCFGYLGL